MDRKTCLIYFSPTGNTRKSLDAMAGAVGGCKEILDVTAAIQMEERSFKEDDFVIWGAPVYAGRIPNAAKERFSNFTGSNTPCIVAVTYGNRDYDDALLELADMAKEQGFIVKGAAALIGRHTYGEIQITRPNAEDLAADREFAEKVWNKPDDADTFMIPGNSPYKEVAGGGKFHPLTSDACTKCGICVKECPVQAIEEDCITIKDACLSCFRCIRNCPVNAKNMDVEGYNTFAAGFTEKLKNPRDNQYYL